MASELCRLAVAKGSRVLFLVPRRELGFQALEKLEQFGLNYGQDVGLYMAGIAGADEIGSTAPITIASKDTLTTRLRMGRIPRLPSADLVIVDEAHLSTSGTWLELLKHYLENGSRIVGLTATPGRKSGRGLGAVYEEIVQTISVSELTELGYLAKARYFSPSTPDLEKLKKVRGDFAQRELAERVNRPKHVGDVVSNYLAYGEARQTICFAVDRAHSIELCAKFIAAGINARHVDGRMAPPEREELMSSFKAEQFQVLTNCQIGTYGLDVPSLSCVILARPTASLVLHLQMLGRGLRAHSGKSNCLIFDHAGNLNRHGLASSPYVWSITDGQAKPEQPSTAKGEHIREQMECPNCRAVYKPQPACPECGSIFQTQGKGVTWVEGQLLEKSAISHQPNVEERKRLYRELLGYCVKKQKKLGYAAFIYKDKFGDWPAASWKSLAPSLPGLPALNYIKSRQIAHRYAKPKTG